MQCTMNYAYDFQAAQLVHRPAKKESIANLKPPKPKAAPHRRGLDPEDLTRRLQFVIAERKAYDENKRKPRILPSNKTLRAQKPSEERSTNRKKTASDSAKDKRKSRGFDQPTENSLAARFRRRASKAALDEQASADPALADGPYVPRLAASQFADTTLGDSPPDKSQIHKLSRAALKYHMDGVNGDTQVISTSVPGAAPIEQAKALRRAQTMRDKNYDRNQFQASSMPENLDPVIMSPLAKRRSIYAAQAAQEKQLRASRRKSTGSFLGGDPSSRYSVFLPPLNGTDLQTVAEAHRVDWTQSDEVCATIPPRSKSASPAQSIKGESKWKLRGRLNSFHRNREGKSPSPPPDNMEVPKSPMASLFARFKR